jgi:glutamine synthetase type III
MNPEERHMTANKARRESIAAVRDYTAPATIFPNSEAPGEIFGQNVFTKAVMQKRLPKPVFKSVMATIEHSKPLDPSVAVVVAVVMKDWAMEKGATQKSLLPAMLAIRAAADSLEGLVADDLWPLPTYQEMLFIL